jgi:hypothetical protein
VLRRASPQQAVEVAGRIRGQIAQIRPSALGTHEPVTVSFSSDTIAASGEASLACFRKRLGGNLCKAASHCGRSPRTVTHSAIRAFSTTNGDTACHLLPS